MDKQIQKITPDYVAIFTDIIKKKFPEKEEVFKYLMSKKELDTLEVLNVNKQIFGSKNITIKTIHNKYNSYKKRDIFKILIYQRKYELNNSQLAKHFSLSRNTVAKWKKIFDSTI